jgi:hypothetical protein
MKKLSLLTVCIFFIFLFNTCEKDNNTKPSQKEIKVYNVTYTDNTVVIDSLDIDDVRIDTAAYTYYFDNNDPNLDNLETGDIIILYGVALRKVTSIDVVGNETRVETEYASLNEAIKDGEISWNKKISFKDGVVPAVLMDGKPVPFKSTSSDGYEFEFTYGQYDYSVKFDFAETSANVEFGITKKLVNPITAKFTATGTINNFNSFTDMKFENSTLTSFEQKNADISGDLTLNLTVAGSGSDALTFDFPVVLFKYPLMVGLIPVVINVKVLFVVNCVVPVDGSSQVEAKFSYNSTTGVKYDGSSVSADATIGDYTIGKKVNQTGASSAIAANFGLAFPRLELEVFGETIVPYIQTAFLIGGDYTFTPACQQAKAQFIGACGVDLSFLGFGYSAKKTLWQEEKILLQSGDCAK